MAEEVTAVLRMSKDGITFGFQVRQIDIGEHVIYKILENTPADMCAKVEIGDIVLKINGEDVTGLATKDVVKRVRVSPNPMTLHLRKDPQVKRAIYEMIKSTSPDRVLHHQQKLQHQSPQSSQGPEEYTVELRRKKDDTRLGFVVRATDVLDHVIVEIRQDSPAALCGKVEVGDVFLKINETDAQQYSPRDVLKCLGSATEPIKLRLKRDPWIKKYLREQYQQEQLVMSDDSIESQSCKVSSDNTNGSPSQPVSRLAQPKRSKLLSLDSALNLTHSPNNTQAAGGRTPGNGNPHAVRECLSESACRPSRIPQAVTQSNWSAPQSPSRGRKPPRPSQIPTARPDMLVTRFVMTGESQFETRYFADQPRKRIKAPLVNYDTLSSSTSRSEDNSNSSCCLIEDNANNDPTQPPSPASPLSPANGPPVSDNNLMGRCDNGAEDGGPVVSKKKSHPSHGSNGNNNLPTGVLYGSIDTNGDAAKKEEHGGERAGRRVDDVTVGEGGNSGNQNAYSNAKLAEDANRGECDGRGETKDCDSSKGGVPSEMKRAQQQQLPRHHTGSRTKADPTEISYSVPTSPTTYGACSGSGVGGGSGGDHLLSAGNAVHDQQHRNNNEMSINSMPTSPEYAGAGGHHHHQMFRYGTGTAGDGSVGAAGGDTSSGELTANTNMSSGSGPNSGGGGLIRKCDAAGFRTSRSEDHLQQTQRDGGIGAVVSIDIDEDVNSSLNTLLDTRHDSQEYAVPERERFLWSYNAQSAPKTVGSTGGENVHNATEPGANVVSPQSFSSSVSSSPQRSASDSPASPTSVSSSVMSSSGGSREHSHAGGGGTGTASSSIANNLPGGQGGNHFQHQQQHHQHQQQQHSHHHHHQQQHHNQHQPLQQQHSSGGQHHPPSQQSGYGGRDHSVSEAVSNISSPDYQDEHDLLSTKDLMAMAISDPSDSDSTILISENTHRCDLPLSHSDRDHKLVIQVKSGEGGGASELEEDYDGARCLALLKEAERSELESFDSLGDDGMMQPGAANLLSGYADSAMYGGSATRESSPPVSDDGSDVDSLHSFHYSPKGVDLPSAERLAKRLYYLEGFKKSDVSRQLCKNNDFSRAVAEEYLKFFFFECLSLDKALRMFLKQFSLTGETQERERVLVHFSKRYLDCNPHSFNSQDAVHTLTCAIMLLNTDLHGQNIGSKMTCAEFIDNLSDLNDGENFPKGVLKQLYYSIKDKQLEWALDDDVDPKTGNRTNDGNGNGGNGNGLGGVGLVGVNGGSGDGGATGGSLQGPPVGPNPFLEAPPMFAAVEYKKGYVMRKCCYDTNYKKTPFGRRSWKMFFCTLRDLVLYLHKDEHGFRKNQMSDNVHNAIRIHHALATRASDYTKKQHVFRLQTADQSEFLFQTSDSKELQSWIDTINFVCASFSAPPLEGGVGSQKRFQRPLLPCTHSRLLMRDQMASHERQVNKIMHLLEEHKVSTAPPKGLALQNYKEKEVYLQYELKRYKTYYNLLSSRLTMEPQDFNNQHQVSAAALNDTGDRRDDSCSTTMLPLAGFGDFGAANSHPAPPGQQQQRSQTAGSLMPNFIQAHQGGNAVGNARTPGLSPPETTTGQQQQQQPTNTL
ncbi:PH and SEC7 domain-containing protein isoform X2 [Anopheles stephensi]|uniref:PH and SEC7 domain-containing protein isoform X2 n=1 Tax=Anopheles stephensi TaxID=30069 RepID=UPI001658AFDC|nr:PH and SEC7 domain-containing protein isoform X2 [Anopheles stephensi]